MASRSTYNDAARTGLVIADSLAEVCRDLGTPRVAVAAGVFDGLHRGHQAILKALFETARKQAAAPVVLTFEPHPRAVLNGPGHAPRLLTPRPYQLHLLHRLGTAAVVILPFTPEFARLPAEAFVREYLLSPGVDLRAVCVGREWRFGTRGRGDANLLHTLGRKAGFEVIAVPPVHLYSRPVSSTRIREAVARGRLTLARRLLKRPFAVAGPVVRGRRIGSRLLHCPTSNLDCSGMQLPPPGVYAAYARHGDVTGGVYDPGSSWKPAALYVGPAPTFGAKRPLSVEVHFLEKTPDLYGRYVDAAVIDFVRADTAFESPEALRQQIQRDLACVREICVRTPHPAPFAL